MLVRCGIYSLPQYLNDQVEKIQKRALKIIFLGVTTPN
jgi:hypothetical protein